MHKIVDIYAAGDNLIKIWDVLSGGRLLMALSSHHKTVTSLCFAMNYKRLVSASLDRLVTVKLMIFVPNKFVICCC